MSSSLHEISKSLSVESVVAPTTGSTVTIPSFTQDKYLLIVNPAGALAALTISLPDSGADIKTIQILFTQTITSLTMSGSTIVNSLNTALATTFVQYIWSPTHSKWYRLS